METIEDLLRLNGQQVNSSRAYVPIFTPIRSFINQELGAILILEGDRLIGLLVEGDSFKKVLLTGKPFNDVQLRKNASQKIFETSPGLIIEQCLALTRKNHVRHLPIIIDGYLVGIISMEDLARIILTENEGI